MKAVLYALAVFCCSALVAQPINVSVLLRNPAPVSLETWRRDPTIVRLQLTNTGALQRDVVVGIVLTNRTTGQTVSTNNAHPCVPVFRLAPGETRVLNGPDLICENALVIDPAIRTSIITAGAIPEGDYEFCVTVLDPTDRRTELATTGARCSNTRVVWPEPPVLIRPLSGDAPQRCDGAIQLQWQPLTPTPAGGVQYRVRAVGMFEGQLPRQALETATRTETIADEVVTATTFIIAPNNPVLMDLVRRSTPRLVGVAWQVEAQDLSGNPIATRGGTRGKSDIGTFSVECPGATSTASCAGAMTLQGYYPAESDTIPWVPPLLVVQWSPYCDDVLRMQYRLSVTDEATGTTYTNSRTLSWPRGPIEGQSLTGQPHAQDRARLIIVNQWDDGGAFVRWNGNLRRGSSYRWTVDATLTRREGRDERTYTPSSSAQRFNLGLRMPTDPNPSDGTTLTSGRGLTLQWTIPAPQHLTRDYLADLVTLRGSGTTGMQFGEAAEFIRVVVARDTSFRTVVASQSFRLPESGNYASFDERVREFFGVRRSTWSNLELSDGTYYWRVEYCSVDDTLRPYRRGPVWRFQVGAGVTASECFRLRPHTPEHRSTVTSPSDGRIQFTLAAEPAITIAAIRSCRIRVWQMSRADEDPDAIRSRTPLLDASVSSTAGASLPLASIPGGAIALNFINTPGAVHTFTATNGQTYLWECELEFNSLRIRSDGTACEITRKTCEGIFTFRTGECNDPCQARLPSNTTPLSGTLAPGDVVRIGHFEAELIRVSGTSENLSGEALVRLPWFNIRIRARFSGLAVNTERQVYEGEMHAVQAAESPLAPELANQLGTALGLTQEQIQTVYAFASNERRLVSSFLANQPVEMPIGFDRVVEGFRVAVGIIGMVFQPTGAYLNAVHVVPMPWLGPGQSLGFGVRNVCFSPNGLGRSLDIYLATDLGYQASDNSWAINLKAPQEARAGLPADSGTFVRITCGGFEFVRLAAEVEFPRTWMVPSPDDGRSRATLRFTTQIRGSGDFIASATMTPFSPVGASGFVLTCENVTVDLSDRDNPDGIIFPSGYTGDASTRWRGFYLGRLQMTLPEALRTFSSGPPTVTVNNLLIDNSGLTFDAVVSNVIGYPQGNFGDWGASIDTIGLRMVSSSLQRGWMNGKIKVPVSDSALVYSALLRDSVGGVRFEFSIVPRGVLNMPLWIASLQLEPTSWVRLLAGGGSGFVAEANFTGRISLGGTREIPLNLGGISFQNMRIRTNRQPYIVVGSWSFASPPHSILGPPEPLPPDGSSSTQSAGGFPISIREFSLTSGSRREGPGVGVRIGLDVNLQGGSSGISGGTTITVWGAFQSSASGPPSFAFSGIDLDSIGIRADMGAVEIEGSVRFYNNDATYGNGFRGQVRANFVKMVLVEATVQFGSIERPQPYRYWYVDARAILASGIPVFSGVGIYGIGGGAWYNMRRVGDPTGVTPTGSSSTTTTASSGGPGATNSGARYEPYYSSSGETFGFYALVTVGTHPEPKAFNCDVRLEVSFEGGGIGEIRLEGNGWMMAGLLERGSAPVTATASISYTFPTRTFHGEFGISVRLEAVTATGRMVLHFAPDVWYVKIGDPEGERVRIDVLSFIQLQAYFMAGMNLPSIPPIPPEVLELTGPIPAPVRPDALGRGNGFAFGARAEFAPPELRFLVFYASIRFLVGFDVALLDYGARAQCADGRPLGANGWYATGQMYARLDASIGLFVDLFFVSGKYEILGLRVGAALQAGLPNPTWIAGACGGSYSILGGAISGYCNFRFTLGERCTPPTESPLAELVMISDITPDDGATDVSIFAEPTAFFNLEPDRPFALEEMRDDGSTVTKVFRIRVGSFTLRRQGSRGNFTVNVPATQVNRSTQQAPAIAIVPTEPLDGLTRYRAEVTAYGQEFTGSFARLPGETIEQASTRAARELGSAASWRDVRYQRGERRGQRVEQVVTTTFTTQPRPDTVVPDWVYLSYPRPRQRFFLQDECRDGSITLVTNPAYLFPASGDQQRSGDTIKLYRVRFINLRTGERAEVPLRYNRIPRPRAMNESSISGYGGEIRFTIPRLANEAIYAVQVVRRDSVIPSETSMRRLRTREGLYVLDGSRSGSQLRSRHLAGLVSQTFRYEDGVYLQIQRRYRPSGFEVARSIGSNEKLLYLYFFRTSRYNRLAEKLRDVSTQRTDSVNVIAVLIPVIGLAPRIESAEGFDPHDLLEQEITVSTGGRGAEREYRVFPLVSTNGWSRRDRWHTSFVNPRVYDELQWVASLRESSSTIRNSTNWRFNRAVRQSESMFYAIQTSHGLVTDAEIAAASGDPALARLARLVSAISRANIVERETRLPAIGIQSSGLRIAAAGPATRMFYSQPTWVVLDLANLTREAARLASLYCGGGDVGYDPETCRRLRRIAAQRFVFPYRGDYTTTWSYPLCQDPDRPVSYDVRFRY